MIKQQIIRNSLDRADYILAYGSKYQEKEKELLCCFYNHENDNTKLFRELDKDSRTKIGGRSARELIVPIPHSFGNNKDLIGDFMYSFMKKVGIDPDKRSTLYICSIHQKENRKGILNSHAHLLFSERPVLDKPVIKHMKERYYDKYGRQCKKADAYSKSPSYDKKIYFGNKYKNNEGKELFSSKTFCKNCDKAWRSTALEFGLNENDFKDIFGKNKNLKSLGNETKALKLYEKGLTKALESRAKIEIFNNKIKKHDRDLAKFNKYANIDKSKLSPLELVFMGNVPSQKPSLDISKLWHEIENKEIQLKIKEIIQEVKDHDKSYDEAEEEINDLERELER